MTVKQLEKEIASIKQRLAKLEQRQRPKNGEKGNDARKTRDLQILRANLARLSAQEKQKRVLEILRAEGMITEPTEREKQIAAEWMARPEEERRRLMEEFRKVAPHVSLAEIVIENRR